jgi:hypothetical protein
MLGKRAFGEVWRVAQVDTSSYLAVLKMIGLGLSVLKPPAIKDVPIIPDAFPISQAHN